MWDPGPHRNQDCQAFYCPACSLYCTCLYRACLYRTCLYRACLYRACPQVELWRSDLITSVMQLDSSGYIVPPDFAELTEM